MQPIVIGFVQDTDEVAFHTIEVDGLAASYLTSQAEITIRGYEYTIVSHTTTITSNNILVKIFVKDK